MADPLDPTVPAPLEVLVAELKRLPGVGVKSAQRFANHLLRVPRDEGMRLSSAIRDALEKIRPCSRCHDLTDTDPCRVCSDPGRQTGVICVVEDPWSARHIEKSGAFRGTYHVLHGALAPIKGIGPSELRIESLIRRVREEETSEVILATSPTTDGEATAGYIATELADLPTQVTRIAYGLPVGSDLEAVDEVTISRALDGRRPLSR